MLRLFLSIPILAASIGASEAADLSGHCSGIYLDGIPVSACGRDFNRYDSAIGG